LELILIEDDQFQAAALTEAARGAGWQVQHFPEPSSFFHAAPTLKMRLLVVDWNLPQMDGGQVILRVRQLYQYSVPIIVITSDHTEAVALKALGLDADDFVHKPVSAPVFVARVEAVHRRYARDRDSHAQFKIPPYSLDRLTHVLCIHDVPVALTPREFDLAWLLFSNTDRFLSRAELMASVWGARADINSHSLAQHMHALRRKLDLAGHGYTLRSVYGAGYRFSVPF